MWYEYLFIALHAKKAARDCDSLIDEAQRRGAGCLLPSCSVSDPAPGEDFTSVGAGARWLRRVVQEISDIAIYVTASVCKLEERRAVLLALCVLVH